jgi:hypothetical protein
MAVDRPASREAEKNISPQGVEANRNWAGASMLSSMAIAIIIHILIALVIGSYVVFEGIVPVPFSKVIMSIPEHPSSMTRLPWSKKSHFPTSPPPMSRRFSK